jgi:hypothetical protein
MKKDTERMPLPPGRQPSPAEKEAKAPARRRHRIEQAERDVEGGLKDTDRRGVPNDVPPKK